MITAKQRFIKYLNETGALPDLQRWLSWGYSEKYYYQIKRQVLSGQNQSDSIISGDAK